MIRFHSVTPQSAARMSLLLGLLLLSTPAAAKQFLSADEALELAFPGCTVSRGTEFLSESQLAKAAELAGAAIPGALVHPYRATCNGKPGGVAYFDVHRVRTLPERIMIVVTVAGRVGRIEVLTFDEPQDYLPRAGWYGQFPGKGLADGLRVGDDIGNVAGATLSGRATALAVRRVLAIHRVLQEMGSP